jgi:general secretion pathway protein K
MTTRRPQSSPPRGIALMVVMMVIFALTVIVAAFAYSMTVEMRLAQITDYDVELEWMGRSGVELARYALATKCAEQRDIDSLNQFWAGGTSPCSNEVPQFSLTDYPLGNGKISVTITDMERKFDINLVANRGSPQMEILQKALAEAGVTDPTEAGTIIYSILDWVSASPEGHVNGAKDDYYNRMDPPYYCKSGPIDDISELLLIKGITPDIYWGPNSTNHPPAAYQKKGFDHTPHSTKSRFANEADEVPNPVGLVELFSPYGAKLNINTASAKTLQLLPGMDANSAQRIIEQRAGPDGADGTDDDMPFHSIGELNNGLPGGAPPGMSPPGPPGGARPGVTELGTPPGGTVPPPPGTAGPGGVPGAPVAGGAAARMGNFCDVRSYVYEVHVVAEVNDVKRTFIGIVSRSSQNATQLQCVRFYWEE